MIKVNRSKLIFVLSLGLLCHVTGMDSETESSGKDVPPEEFVSEWSNLFAGATNLVSEKGSDRFAAILKERLDKKNKELSEGISSFLFPDQDADITPEQLMQNYLDQRNAVQSIAAPITMVESWKEGTLSEIAEVVQWKMFFLRFKTATGGQRVMLAEDQKRWLEWRKAQMPLIVAAGGAAFGANQTWFENLAINEIEIDRLNEWFAYDEIYAEIYRDLKYASVRYKGRDVPMKQGRLYVAKDGKTRVGRIINPVFCKRVIVGRDIYKFAILEPDYIVDVGSHDDTFSRACIWKNGKNSANYRLPIDKKVVHLALFSEERRKKSGIKSISVSNSVITIVSSKGGKPVVIDLLKANSESID